VKLKFNIPSDMALSTTIDNTTVSPLPIDDKYMNHASDLTPL